MPGKPLPATKEARRCRTFHEGQMPSKCRAADVKTPDTPQRVLWTPRVGSPPADKIAGSPWSYCTMPHTDLHGQAESRNPSDKADSRPGYVSLHNAPPTPPAAGIVPWRNAPIETRQNQRPPPCRQTAAVIRSLACVQHAGISPGSSRQLSETDHAHAARGFTGWIGRAAARLAEQIPAPPSREAHRPRAWALVILTNF